LFSLIYLFLSEFGLDTTNKEISSASDVPGSKAQIQALAASLNLPYLVVVTAFFIDIFFNPVFGFDIDNGVLSVVGDGTQPISFATTKDIARFVVHKLVSEPKARLENGVLRVEADRKTFKEVAEIIGKAKGKKIEVKLLPVEPVLEKTQKDRSVRVFLFTFFGG
jgi:uncharacterized protein YbjT (DUF2867 family)